MIRIFACCAREDEAQAGRVLAAVKRTLDADVYTGAEKEEQSPEDAAREIRGRDMLLYLASRASAASPRCEGELRCAIACGRLILAVSLDGTGKPAALEAARGLQWYPLLTIEQGETVLACELAGLMPMHLLMPEERQDGDDELDRWLKQRAETELGRARKRP